MPRKTAPKVKHGRVQKKNNWAPQRDSVFLAGTAIAFLRRRPGPGYRHLLRASDIERFIALLPDWDELATGLQVVILDAGEWDTGGWHDSGAIGICAWNRDLWIATLQSHVNEHQRILDRLGVEVRTGKGESMVCWTESTARAYQLLHVFLHELGHHHDRMTTRSKTTSARGEPYAESYANRYADQIWEAYETEFGW
jgi:hypothetical protein